MKTLDIIQLEKNDFYKKDVTLRNKSLDVFDFGDEFQKEVDILIETFRKWKIAVGLSAPQIGIFKRFSIINLDKSKFDDDLIIVNPEIKSLTGKKDIKKESCMSLPQVRGDVERRDKLVLTYHDRYGNTNEIKLEGFKSRVVQHEIDHLDGILFVDRMNPDKVLENIDMKWE
jgi:peptide deformylase